MSTPTTDTTYNGWANYETWAVKLWIDNEEPAYRAWQDRTRQAWRQAAISGKADHSADARITLADELKGTHEESMPDLPGVWADLLGAALSEVDWFEIANALLEDADLDGYEPHK